MSSELKNGHVVLPDDESDWVRAVASLIRLTEEGKIKWKSAQAPQSLKEQQVHVVFMAEYDEKRLRLYVATEKIENPYPINVGVFKTAYPYWTRDVILELGDKREAGWYTLPETEAAKELLESVEYQVYGVDDFLSKILETGESSDDE